LTDLRCLAAWKLSSFFAAVTLALSVTTGIGQQPGSFTPPRQTPPARNPSRSPSLRTVAPLLEALDRNHDGVIDADEIDSASDSLESLDKNSDGELTEDEYTRPVRSTVPGRRPGFGLRGRGFPPVAPPPQGGLENFGVVDDHLFRGAQPSVAGIQTLKALGVTALIDLTLPDTLGEIEKAEAEARGISYFSVPMESLAPPAPGQVSAILSIITNSPGKVFLHCRAGKDRTGTIVACYRMVHCNWSNEEALHEANLFRMAPGAVQMKEFIRDFRQPEASPTDQGQAPGHTDGSSG
jgi:protein-tyrosine phosphatase